MSNVDFINLMTKLKYEILIGVQRSINIAFLHQKTFGEFRNKFQGKTVVLVAPGPTLKYYEPIENAIYVGVNRTFLYDDIKFDYLFAIDKHGLETTKESYTQAFFDYKGNNCIKFVGDQNSEDNMQIPEGKLNNNIRRYKTTTNLVPNEFTVDIDVEPIGNLYSVSFQAMQFILFTNPAKIYLVGMDNNSSISGHFKGATYVNEALTLKTMNVWKKIVKFVNVHYPDTEIFSVNPVGLKGIFNDIYTKKYLQSEDKMKFDEDFEEFLNAPVKDYLEKINFSEQYTKLQKRLDNKKVVIYGSGRLFQIIHKMYDISKLNVIALADKKYITSESKFCGFKTIPPTEIIKYNPDCIIVATLEYVPIVSYLKSLFTENQKIEILPLANKDYV